MNPSLAGIGLVLAHAEYSTGVVNCKLPLSSIGEACRSILTETLRDTLHWAFERVQCYGWDQERVVAPLDLAGDSRYQKEVPDPSTLQKSSCLPW